MRTAKQINRPDLPTGITTAQPPRGRSTGTRHMSQEAKCGILDSQAQDQRWAEQFGAVLDNRSTLVEFFHRAIVSVDHKRREATGLIQSWLRRRFKFHGNKIEE